MFTARFFRNFCSKASKFEVYPPLTPVRGRSLVDSIALSKDQLAFYAWHPKKEIPYECTRPLPPIQEQITSSLLKEEKIEEAMRAHRVDYPEKARQKLQDMTFTTKHRWFPKARLKKHNFKKTGMDRPYL